MNSTLNPLAVHLSSQTTVSFPKDSFITALTKNIVAMLVWLALSMLNGSMVRTFTRHSFFYEDPRYIMFIFMVVNDAVQLTLVTALYVVSYIFFKIPASLCCPLVMTAVLTTRATPLILAGMAVERYLAICFPLHYQQLCTIPRTLLLVGAVLFLSAAAPLTDLFITLAKEPIAIFRGVIFCDQYQLFRDRAIYYKNCGFDAVYFSFVFLALLFTYCKIMLAARAASTDQASVRKARNTILLHGIQLLLCLLAFVVPSMQAPLIALFPQFGVEIRYVNFLLVYIIPRFLSPMIYGFRDEKFRKHWARQITCRASAVRPAVKLTQR